MDLSERGPDPLNSLGTPLFPVTTLVPLSDYILAIGVLWSRLPFSRSF